MSSFLEGEGVEMGLGGDDDTYDWLFSEGDDDDDDGYYDDHDNLRQQKALAILPKFTSFLSLIGSACIISEVLADRRPSQRSHSSVNRILLSMSISDAIFSIGWFLGVWPSPKDSTYHQWGAVGTTRTCTFQGFLLQLGWTAGPLFNLTLSMYYLLIIRYNWREDNLKNLDPYVQGTIWCLALGLAILPIPLKLYNNSWEVCWIDTLPLNCDGSSTSGDNEWEEEEEEEEHDGDACIRGDGDTTWLYALLLSSVFPSYLCMLLSVVFMGVIYCSVRQMETRNLRWSHGHRTKTSASSQQHQHQQNDSPDQNQAPNSNSKARRPSVRRGSGAGSDTGRATRRGSHGGFSVSGIGTAAADAAVATAGAAVAMAAAVVEVVAEVTTGGTQTAEENRIRARSRRVRSQALLFCGAFYFSFLPDAISTFIYTTTGTWYFWLDIFVYGICMPIQGLLNCLVFLRQREEMKSPLGRIVRRIICCGVCENIPALTPKSIFQTLPTMDPSALVRKSMSFVDPSSVFSFVARRPNSEDRDGDASSISSFVFGRRRSGFSSGASSLASLQEDSSEELMKDADNTTTPRRRGSLDECDLHSDIEVSDNSSDDDDDDDGSEEIELGTRLKDVAHFVPSSVGVHPSSASSPSFQGNDVEVPKTLHTLEAAQQPRLTSTASFDTPERNGDYGEIAPLPSNIPNCITTEDVSPHPRIPGTITTEEESSVFVSPMKDPFRSKEVRWKPMIHNISSKGGGISTNNDDEDGNEDLNQEAEEQFNDGTEFGPLQETTASTNDELPSTVVDLPLKNIVSPKSKPKSAWWGTPHAENGMNGDADNNEDPNQEAEEQFNHGTEFRPLEESTISTDEVPDEVPSTVVDLPFKNISPKSKRKSAWWAATHPENGKVVDVPKEEMSPAIQ